MTAGAASASKPARWLGPGALHLASATLFATLTTTAVTPIAADDGVDARDLLERMVRASHSLDYVGTFVYRNGTVIQSMKIIHRADANGSRERLLALSGVPREVIRDDRWVTCILPDDQMVVVSKRRPGGMHWPGEFGSSLASDPGVEELYTLSKNGIERVANREAFLIDVRPKDRYRYGFRIAADRQTGLLLKSELLDDDMTVLEQIVYTHLELPDAIPDEALEPQALHAGFARYEAIAPEGGGSGSEVRAQEWAIGWLPVGFRMKGSFHDPIHPDRNPVEHRVYSDGLVSLSIFIEQGFDARNRHEGHSSVGAFNAFGRIVDDFQLSVVGEVPGITVAKVAASIMKR